MGDSLNILDFIFDQQQTALETGGLYEGSLGGTAIPSAHDNASLSFDYAQAATDPGVGLSVTILTFIVPEGYDGIIERISHNTTSAVFVDGSGDYVWRISIDNRPVKNYSAMTFQFGSLQIPRPIAGIRIQSGQTVTYTLTHVANPALNGSVIATLAGYFFPRVNGN